MIRLLAHPLPPSPVINLPLFLSLSICRRPSLLTRGRRGWARNQIIRGREKGWPCTNHSILSAEQYDSTSRLSLYELTSPSCLVPRLPSSLPTVDG